MNRIDFDRRRVSFDPLQNMRFPKQILFSFLSAVLMFSVSLATEARAKATCFCVLSTDNIEGRGTPLGFHIEQTGEVNTSYTGVYQQHEDNQVDCARRCRTQIETYKGSANSAAPFCAVGFKTGQGLAAYSKVGTRNYRKSTDSRQTPDFMILLLENVPQEHSVTYTCPATWISNSSGIPGGQTADGRCKKLAGKISPEPSAPTNIGEWGFTWGNEVWAYGSAANGGAPTSVVFTGPPGVCRWYP